eukprot:3226288-Alexandrium_andersonii.AAC.1
MPPPLRPPRHREDDPTPTEQGEVMPPAAPSSGFPNPMPVPSLRALDSFESLSEQGPGLGFYEVDIDRVLDS